jgi:hypothetical protein
MTSDTEFVIATSFASKDGNFSLIVVEAFSTKFHPLLGRAFSLELLKELYCVKTKFSD